MWRAVGLFGGLLGLGGLHGCSTVDEKLAEEEEKADEAEQAQAAVAAVSRCASADKAKTTLEEKCVLFPADEAPDRVAVMSKVKEGFKFRCVDCTGACKEPYQVQKVEDDPKWKADAKPEWDGAEDAGGTWEHASLVKCSGEAEKNNENKDRMCGGFIVALFKDEKPEFCSEAMVKKALGDQASALSRIAQTKGGGDKSYDHAVVNLLTFHLAEV